MMSLVLALYVDRIRQSLCNVVQSESRIDDDEFTARDVSFDYGSFCYASCELMFSRESACRV
jgi:hypothetical protein